VRTPDGKSRPVDLDSERIGVGRSSVNELCYPDDSGLSRQHMAFEKRGDAWVAIDLGSKNGTLVNGAKLTGPHVLQPGDRVTAGHLTIEYGVAAITRPAETVVFVEPAPQEELVSKTSTTVSTNLAGVLGSSVEEVAKTKVFQGSPQMRALIRAGKELSEHRPLAELFEVIMDLSIEAVGAGRGVLMTLEGEELVVRAARGSGFQISSAVRDRVLEEKASLLVRDAQMDKAFKERMSIVEQKVRSMLAAPLQTNDRVIGLIYLDSPHFIREFSTEDLNLLTVMANVAAIRIEHARLAEVEQVEKVMARELEQAAQIQRGLLPKGAPRLKGLDIAGHNASCRTVGGDYYDFIAYPDGRVAILVADVAGKGMPAALMMSSLQARVQVIFEEPDNLAAKVGKLNRAVSSTCPTNRFITFFVCVVDPRSGEIAYCNAGHNPPLLVRSGGAVEQLDGGGMILGIMAKAQYQECRSRMEEGDVTVFFSDGVTEAPRPGTGEDFGEDRLAKLVAQSSTQPAVSIVNEVLDAVAAYTAGQPAADDITVVVARRVSQLHEETAESSTASRRVAP
jgi:serine phosphatase RsbU (regulator of sigma subunit)